MKTLSCNATSKLERLGLLASLMDSDGMRPPIDGCDVMLLTLGDRRGDAWVQFLAAAPKEAMEKLIEAAMDADALTEEAAALNERKNVHWLEMCSRIFMYSPYGQANTLGEQLAIRCIKEHLDTVDPEGEFSHVSDRIWRESISGKMSELVKKVRYYDDGSLEDLDYQGEDLAMRLLRKPSEIESIEETGSLEVIRCRPLIPEEVADVRGSLPVEWLPLLPETGRDRDVESGLDRGSSRFGRGRCCLIVSAISGLFIVGGAIGLAVCYAGNSQTDKPTTLAGNVTTSEALLNTSAVTTSTVTTTRYPSRFNTRLTESVLNGLQILGSKCQELFYSPEYMSGSSHVLDADAGPYPCGGGSGQLLCAAHQSNSVGTCHHFGGPWTYEAFAVKEAIGHYLQDSKGCVVRCAGEEEALRNLWEETRRNLLSIPPYPGRGFLKFTKRVSVPNLNDFEAMMRPRYPVEENCSGSCVDCVEDTGTRKCSCNFARVKCQVRTKGEQEENNIELVAYNEDPRFLFGKLSPFSKKKDVYQVVGCDYECRKGSPDVAVPANVRFLETEPAGDGSPLKLRLSRRELSRLQLPLAQCEGYDTDDWHPLEEIGRYPCWGGSGVMMCKKGSLRCHLGKKIFGGCNKLQPVSCHRFGPVWMDVFAVQDAVKRHADKFDDCVVRCDGTRTMANDLWEEAKDGLRTDPQYERPPANLRVGFEDWLREHYFADPSCSSSCGFQHNGPAVIPTLLYRHSCSNIPDCLCRVAHVKCQIVLSKSKHHQQVESWGFNARTQDVLKMLSLADANAKSEHPQTNDIHTKSCRSDCYGVM